MARTLETEFFRERTLVEVDIIDAKNYFMLVQSSATLKSYISANICPLSSFYKLSMLYPQISNVTDSFRSSLWELILFLMKNIPNKQIH